MKSALLTIAGLLLSTAVVATGCGGGSDTMRVTLTDDGCTYEGDTTPAPGLFDIEVENRTSHFANFTLSALMKSEVFPSLLPRRSMRMPAACAIASS